MIISVGHQALNHSKAIKKKNKNVCPKNVSPGAIAVRSYLANLITQHGTHIFVYDFLSGLKLLLPIPCVIMLGLSKFRFSCSSESLQNVKRFSVIDDGFAVYSRFSYRYELFLSVSQKSYVRREIDWLRKTVFGIVADTVLPQVPILAYL